MTDTLVYRAQQHRDRWSWFGGGDVAGIVELSAQPTVAELKAIDLFRDYDDAFLERISPDVSIASWAADAVLFEEGSYIDVAFFVVEGAVAVYLASKQPEAGSPGEGESSGAVPIFQTASSETGTVRPDTSDTVYHRRATDQEAVAQGAGKPTMLSVMDFDLPSATATVELGAGEFFGEIGALSGWPQSVTARTRTPCRLVQIRLPALRLMKRRSESLKSRLDALYRERSLVPQLKACPLFAGCADADLDRLAGDATLVSCGPEEVLFAEGDRLDGVFLVRSGFLKLRQAVGESERAVSYLSKGQTIGEIELLLEGLNGAQCTASSVGYSELVRIPAPALQALLAAAPAVHERLWQRVVSQIKATGATRIDSERSEFVEIALREGLVEGNSILVIDLERCTRCDDCVRACASTHEGRPRFIREGERHANLLIAKSCYHCQDPVCLVGCPTGAIRRANVGDVVEIKDAICIGCGTCGNNCPYDAIVLHETDTVWPSNALPKSLRGTPRSVASKCDLCHTSEAGPACVRNCPHQCAFRVGSLAEFEARLRHGERP